MKPIGQIACERFFEFLKEKKLILNTLTTWDEQHEQIKAAWQAAAEAAVMSAK